MPEVEARYRAARYRLLAGHSLGGLFALFAMSEPAAGFSAYLAVSPTLDWGGEWPLRRIEQWLHQDPPTSGTVFVAWGDEGSAYRERVEKLRRILDSRSTPGLTWTLRHLSGEDHGSVVPESLLNRIGYDFLAAGDADRAIEAFRRNAERYPRSANVHDSLGEAYERAGRIERAKRSFRKAYELGRASGDPATPIYRSHLDRLRRRAVRPESNRQPAD